MDKAVEHFDVIIVGAGISGVGSAYHLQTQCPGKSYVVLEMKDTFGGTWETHKYPGVRSDSDLYTFGYRFKPWIGKPIATAQEILSYMGEVIEENGIDDHIRYGHRITDYGQRVDLLALHDVPHLLTSERTVRVQYQLVARQQLYAGIPPAGTVHQRCQRHPGDRMPLGDAHHDIRGFLDRSGGMKMSAAAHCREEHGLVRPHHALW